MNDELHNKVVKFFYDHEELFIAIMNKTPYQSDGWDYEIEVVKEFLTANQSCYCGDIYNLGVIHRDDGPCHYPDHKEPEQDSGKTAPPKEWGEVSREELIKRELEMVKRIAKAELTLDGLTPTEFALRELYEFQEATGCDTVIEFKTQRKPLTDEQITAILERGGVAERNDCCGWHVLPYALARAIEAAHGIKE